MINYYIGSYTVVYGTWTNISQLEPLMMAILNRLTILALHSVYLIMVFFSASSGFRDYAIFVRHFPGKVYLPASSEYVSDTQNVANLIRFVHCSRVTDQTPLAVRSDGHTAWAGSANIHEGITVGLLKLDRFVGYSTFRGKIPDHQS